ADREYLENAMRVVPPVDDLPIPLPAGRRDSYPADEGAMRSLADRYGVREACSRLLAAVRRLGSDS
ncbi:MAG: flap endonuclease, partial [Solirubrobacteraceae bacterium]